MEFITDVLKEVLPLLKGAKPRFIVEFFSTPHGEGSGEAVAIAEGEHPSVGEFILRIPKKGESSLHRISKIQYVLRDSDFIPYLIAPQVSREYYQEISDAYTDFIVTFVNRKGDVVASLNCKNSIVPDIGTNIIRDEIVYDVTGHYHVAHAHMLQLAVRAVEPNAPFPKKRKRTKKKR